MRTCPLCNRFELRIRNLQEAIEAARADTFKFHPDPERKAEKVERLLRLRRTVAIVRNDYDLHQKIHKLPVE
jgi:hypothetical protein